MKTAVSRNYKPTDALSASGFMAGLLADHGLVSNDIYIEMITKLVLVDTAKRNATPFFKDLFYRFWLFQKMRIFILYLFYKFRV